MPMAKKISLGGIIIIAITTVLLLAIGFARIENREAKKSYMVYLDGKKMGLIQDRDELYNLIDDEQEAIKNDFSVEKVYPPEGLEAIEYTTFSQNYKSANEIYNTIASNSTFTIKGYTITIKKDEGEPVYINILNREDLEPALMDAISTFISSDGLKAYINDTQVQIVDTGKTIENIYFDEKITIKEAYIPVDSMIITNKSDLTKYLLFGTLEKQKEYTVKEGDNLETIAFNNELSNEELLIANPDLASINALISPGQKLNIGLINPLFTVVEEAEVIEDTDEPFKTVVEKNSSIYPSQSYTKQQGVKGKNRVTEKVLRKNGEIQTLYVTASTRITEPINKIYVQGTKVAYNFQDVPPAASNTDWGWPTISPYVITSRYGWRWGRMHRGIDISGSGFGSPIYSSTDGVVVNTFSGCADRGYYGSTCGGGLGNSVTIKASNGLIVYYAHMRSQLRVSIGQTVTKGQVLGYMGDSGSSTGTHLHFQINDASGNSYDPCKVAFSC